MDRIASLPVPFIFIYGPRGTGKTYGALKDTYEKRLPFLYLRRQRQEYEAVAKDESSPFKSLNEDLNLSISVRSINKALSGFYEPDNGSPIGYLTSLVNVATLRGIDLSDVKRILYDEFIPEPHVRPIKEEGQAFLNAYETLNRNREIKGQEPIKVLALANSNYLANPIFMELELVSIAEKMRKSGENFRLLKDRGIALIDAYDSPIAEGKRETALYKLVNKDSEFYKMASENRFRDLDEAASMSRPLKEYTPVVRIGEITLYRHKSERRYYCSKHHSGVCPKFGFSSIEIERCMKKNPWITTAYLTNKIDFEDYISEALFNKYLF